MRQDKAKIPHTRGKTDRKAKPSNGKRKNKKRESKLDAHLREQIEDRSSRS